MWVCLFFSPSDDDLVSLGETPLSVSSPRLERLLYQLSTIRLYLWYCRYDMIHSVEPLLYGLFTVYFLWHAISSWAITYCIFVLSVYFSICTKTRVCTVPSQGQKKHLAFYLVEEATSLVLMFWNVFHMSCIKVY